jgi:hypothetical protein
VVAKGLVIDLMTSFRIVAGSRGIRKLSRLLAKVMEEWPTIHPEVQTTLSHRNLRDFLGDNCAAP